MPTSTPTTIREVLIDSSRMSMIPSQERLVVRQLFTRANNETDRDQADRARCQWRERQRLDRAQDPRRTLSRRTSVALNWNSSRIIAMTGGTARILSRSAFPANQRNAIR